MSWLSTSQKRRELRSTRLGDAFCAAQGRRLALQDADKERLRKEHELVMVRLVGGSAGTCIGVPKIISEPPSVQLLIADTLTAGRQRVGGG